LKHPVDLKAEISFSYDSMARNVSKLFFPLLGGLRKTGKTWFSNWEQ